MNTIIAEWLNKGGMLALTMDGATDDDLSAIAYDVAAAIATGTRSQMLHADTTRTPVMVITDDPGWSMDLSIASAVQEHERENPGIHLKRGDITTLRADGGLIWTGDGYWLESELPGKRYESDLDGFAGIIGGDLIRYLDKHAEIGVVVIATVHAEPDDIKRIKTIAAATAGDAAVIGIVRTPTAAGETRADIAYRHGIPCLTARVTYKGGAAYD